MSGPSANLSVWVGEQAACVRIAGRANFSSSVDFKRVMGHLRSQGCRQAALDLTDCAIMDSTFLGVLVKLGFDHAAGATPLTITLLNPNDRVSELLDNLGVANLFTVDRCQEPAAGAAETVASDGAVSRQEIARTCLEAHLALMEANPANQPRFKDVTQFFEEQVRKLEALPKPDSPG